MNKKVIGNKVHARGGGKTNIRNLNFILSSMGKQLDVFKQKNDLKSQEKKAFVYSMKNGFKKVRMGQKAVIKGCSHHRALIGQHPSPRLLILY